MNEIIQQEALRLQQTSEEPLAAYLYDLPSMEQHLKTICEDLSGSVELFYAVKANPDTRVLSTVASFVDGLEIASGGELELIQPYLNNKPYIFGGPGKLDSDIQRAITNEVDCLHVESLGELRRVICIAAEKKRHQPILLRLNPVLPDTMKTTLTMAGRATAFGIDEAGIGSAIELAKASEWVDLQGFHIHALSHQLDAAKHVQMLDFLLDRTVELALQFSVDLRVVNLGGGIGVNYRQPDNQYEWSVFANGISALAAKPAYQNLKLRLEMGRYLTAFSGYYLMEVLDLKANHGEYFAICRGGTHQFRLPAAQGHSHPFVCLNNHIPDADSLSDTTVTVVGQLCTPKDIIATQAPVKKIAVGDLLIMPLAGAYAWNISHQQFLCHPAPEFHYLEADI
ncbi:type III PLP-dependent enzyme [Aliamphritea ceti]|uniref:type III PLP-dependent enzyme n=1 Tax=Aliamphritea ceti TaxID=1524258 RepID=UPI0021C290F8|nr:type III PLP-dependent enzyme [Aliamphritea ceti]